LVLRAERVRHVLQVNGIGPGYFETDLTAPQVADPVFSDWPCKRTPVN
jgi:gluconate 5-dehydrogenase